MRHHLFMLSHSDRVYDVVAVLCNGVRSNLTQLVIADHAAAASLHLSIEHIGMHILHEKNYFKRFYIRSCSHEGDSDRDAEVLFCPQVSNQAVRIAG